jgi:hypothetical protein
MTAPYTELIRRTATIVVAETVRIEELTGERSRYRFRVVETVKGRSLQDVALTFRRALEPVVFDDDFDGHRDPRFWDRRSTRQINDSDCQIHPAFAVGSRYLLFVTPPHHWRSFERIITPDDRWLETVRAVANNGRGHARSQSVVQWLREQRSVAVHRIDSCAARREPERVHTLDTLRGVAPPARGWQPVFVDFRACRPGDVFMAIHYDADATFVTAYPITDGVVDLTGAQTEIELTGPRHLPLNELKTSLQ